MEQTNVAVKLRQNKISNVIKGCSKDVMMSGAMVQHRRLLCVHSRDHGDDVCAITPPFYTFVMVV